MAPILTSLISLLIQYERLGSGSPEGVVTGSPGAPYRNTNGGAGATLWMKESGTGNTGWVAL